MRVPANSAKGRSLNNKIDLLQAEAVADLISSASEQAAHECGPVDGRDVFFAGSRGWRKNVTELRVFVEATLDFPEEEIDTLAQTELQDRLADLPSVPWTDISVRAEAGRILAEGLKIAIIGKPNAGKSSLLNRLAQVERAIVSAHTRHYHA